MIVNVFNYWLRKMHYICNRKVNKTTLPYFTHSNKASASSWVPGGGLCRDVCGSGPLPPGHHEDQAAEPAGLLQGRGLQGDLCWGPICCHWLLPEWYYTCYVNREFQLFKTCGCTGQVAEMLCSEVFLDYIAENGTIVVHSIFGVIF